MNEQIERCDVRQNGAGGTIDNAGAFRSPLLTVKEACNFLNCGRSKLYDLIRSKRVPTVKLGSRSTRIPRVALERLASSWEEL